MKTAFTTISLCLALSSSVFAQGDIQRADASRSTRPLTPSAATQTNLNKLWSLDLYGAIPYKRVGGGFGFGMYSPALNFGVSMPNSLQVRFGGDFYILGTGHKTFNNIPLSSPQTGDAKVRLQQNNLGVNLGARVSTSYSNKFIPYADAFVGWRSFNSTMDITPNVQQPGYENSTSSNLSSANHWAYGGAIGFMYSFTPYVKFNTGLMYTFSQSKGEMVDVLNARNENNNIITSKIITPKEMFIFKVGLTFLMKPSEHTTYNNNCNCHCNNSSSSYWFNSNYHGSSRGAANKVSIGVKPNK